MSHWSELLQGFACWDAREWAEGFKTPEAAWKALGRSETKLSVCWVCYVVDLFLGQDAAEKLARLEKKNVGKFRSLANGQPFPDVTASPTELRLRDRLMAAVPVPAVQDFEHLHENEVGELNDGGTLSAVWELVS